MTSNRADTNPAALRSARSRRSRSALGIAVDSFFITLSAGGASLRRDVVISYRIERLHQPILRLLGEPL